MTDKQTKSSSVRAHTRAVRARMAATGENWTAAARHITEQASILPAPGTPTPNDSARRSATATLSYEPVQHSRDSVWSVAVGDDPQYSDGRWLSMPAGVLYNQRTAVLNSLISELSGYGWDITTAPAADPLPDTFTVALIRNEQGLDLDTAAALHAAAGVTWSRAHFAYIEAVAAAVAATGVPVCEVEPEADEPRGGQFRIGESGDEADYDYDEPKPADYIMWREDRGWYEVGFSHRQNALGHYAIDLPGNLGVVALPHDVAAAVLQRFETDGPALAPAEWIAPAGYEANPPLPDLEEWDVSLALERSLTAYASGAITRPTAAPDTGSTAKL